EIDAAGREREWGRVLVCTPPHRLVFSWVLEAPDDATEVEVSFEETGPERCRMRLEHRGWERRRDGALWRGRYDEGWSGVTEGFATSLAG
ncbi:MAG: SRPBCC domain-containing protein, partial [Parvularculaceae bacterium]|nr:SRPBCC domain-containing protein [Parvularculaceae bacterium]